MTERDRTGITLMLLGIWVEPSTVDGWFDIVQVIAGAVAFVIGAVAMLRRPK